jgi:hypothetical protein
VEDRANQEISQAAGNGYALNLSNLEPSTDVSLNTLRLIVEGLWDKIQDLTLADIENVLFFLFVFVILALRYNLKTSFYITCIGLLQGTYGTNI